MQFINREEMPDGHADAVESSAEDAQWTVVRDVGKATLRLSGEWRSANDLPTVDEVAAGVLEARKGGGVLAVDTTGVTRWDSALAIFVRDLGARVQGDGVWLDPAGLPAPLRGLLDLAASAPKPPALGAGAGRPNLFARIGERAIERTRGAMEVVTLLGEVALAAVALLRGRAQVRFVDVLLLMREAGAAALPITTVVNLLIGGILAFIGAVQLQQFGAAILVADLVGIAMAREMSAVMTAIVMAGRTGGAYAAHIATMQGNEEVDALTTFGISPVEHLILPRVLALTLMMPLLYAYACAIGLFGGFMVGTAVLSLTPGAYITETRNALDLTQFALGFIKSACFGALVAIAGCHLGIRAGRSAADVGRAATSAVVVGIVGIIVIDTVFAVVTNFMGI
jgi:phospholipid/cholesterol/gamma-HCH transport system permease protein